MEQFNNSQYLLYTQALKDPSTLSEDDLLQLIVRYPYSQPLIFAYERRKRLLGEESENKSLALLYAPSASWLYNFVISSPDNDTSSSLNDEEEVSLPTNMLNDDVIIQDELSEDCDDSKEVLVQEEAFIEEGEQIASPSEDDELDRLVSQGSVLADYFIFEEKTTDDVSEEVLTEESEIDNVSLYNDDLMPYSFRWWLHKTRLEHADTYQPFSVPNFNKSTSSVVDFGKLDEAILDQQIKEHIIHFQDPEAKLSEEVKQRPVEQTQPKKSDTIIERFIREEPIIQAPSPANLKNENMARQSAEDNFILVTETLATIYKDQGLFQKAIDVFKKLILKYPEKKSYFASQIKELEKNL